jgi:hypothetical protein
MKKLAIALMGIVLITACHKEQEVILSSAMSINSVSHDTVNVTVVVNVSGDINDYDRGVIYGSDKNLAFPTYYTSETKYKQSGRGNGTFSMDLVDIEGNSNEQLNIRPYVRVNGTYYYGDTYNFTLPCVGLGCGPAGGIIIYLDGNGGGIEVADTSFIGLWGCPGTNIDALNTTIGNGLSNTQTMIQNCSDVNTAANKCNNLTYNGFSDWYLPSIDELKLIYDHAYLTNQSGLPVAFYLSSNQADQDNFKSINFGSGNEHAISKSTSGYMCVPIRTF